MNKILIIEDDKNMVSTLTSLLQIKGFEVISAYDGYEGIYKAQKQSPNLVILDLRLPGLPGEEICKELKKDNKSGNLPIIMISAKGQESDRVVGKVIGADYYITKPFDMDDLIVKIRSLIK